MAAGGYPATIGSILALVDASPAADAARSVVCAQAKLLGAKVRGLYVEDERRFLQYPSVAAIGTAFAASPTAPLPLPPDQMREIEAIAAGEAKAAQESLHEAGSALGVPVTFETVRGDVIDEMIRAARMTDIVVMGCRRKSDPDGATNPGSKIQPLVRATPRPVLLVPQTGWSDGPLVLPYDGSPAAVRALPWAATFAKANGFAVHLLAVKESGVDRDQVTGEARTFLAGYSLEATVHTATGPASHAIVALAERVGAGLLVMGAFGHNRVTEWIFGSTTTHVLENLPCSVLLTRP